MEIESEKEFVALMAEIDANLKRSAVPIRARPIEALREVAIRLDQDIIGGPLTTGPVAGNYAGQSLSAHIFTWFDRRYGERLKVDFSVGAAVFVFEGDPWLVKLPWMSGRVYLECKADAANRSHCIGGPAVSTNPTYPRLNVLEQIKAFPKQKMCELVNLQESGFVEWFAESYRFFLKLNFQAHRNPLARAIQHDFRIAAELTCLSYEQYGQARWHALQAAEKSIKFFIGNAGENYSHTHSLKRLLKQAKRLGLPYIPEEVAAHVQCSAALRYGEEESTVEKATHALQQAFLIARHCIHDRKVSGGNDASGIFIDVSPQGNNVESHLQFLYSCMAKVPEK